MNTMFSGKKIQLRHIGILTGGGDCAGLNAVITGLLRRIHKANQGLPTEEKMCLFGMLDGWKSFIRGAKEPYTGPVYKILHLNDVIETFRESGTIIHSSRTNIFSDENIAKGMPEIAMEKIKSLKLDCLCALGGDDTLGAARQFYEKFSFPILGAPKTMDNDIYGTEKTFGFESAYIEASHMIANLQTTAKSHHRIFVVEVMGRHAGWVALFSGLAGGAGIVLLPEEIIDLEKIAEKAERLKNTLGYGIVVVSEGAQIFGSDKSVNAKNKEILDRAVANPKNIVLKARIEEIKEKDAFGHLLLSGAGEIIMALLKELTPKIEYRFQNCGHVIRAVAHPPDIILGLRFGNALFEYMREGRWGVFPALQGGKIIPKPLSEARGERFATDPDYQDMIFMKDLADFL